jgi:hypothetical protein
VRREVNWGRGWGLGATQSQPGELGPRTVSQGNWGHAQSARGIGATHSQPGDLGRRTVNQAMGRAWKLGEEDRGHRHGDDQDAPM